MFQLLFPQPAMLRRTDLSLVCSKLLQGATKVELRTISEAIRQQLNPHPSRQKEENVPVLYGRPVQGIQHKYRETVLFFPAEVRCLLFHIIMAWGMFKTKSERNYFF